MALITTEELKAVLSDAQSGDDEALLTLLVDGVWDLWCKETSRKWELGTYTEFYSTPDGDEREVFLQESPVASVTGLYDDPDWVFGADTKVDASEYLIDADRGIILRMYEFLPGVNNVKVVYTAGYEAADFPASYKLAILEQAAQDYLRLKRFEGWETMSQMTPKFRALTQACRRRRA